MSSHCNKYPGCGCGPTVGTKCHLSTEEIAWLKKNGFTDNETQQLTRKEVDELDINSLTTKVHFLKLQLQEKVFELDIKMDTVTEVETTFMRERNIHRFKQRKNCLYKVAKNEQYARTCFDEMLARLKAKK